MYDSRITVPVRARVPSSFINLSYLDISHIKKRDKSLISTKSIKIIIKMPR